MTKQNYFDASYLIAAKLFGYLWANGAIKKTNLGMTEEQFEQHLVAELARQTRELLSGANRDSYLAEFSAKYGLDSVVSALLWDLDGRGMEWENWPVADAFLNRVKRIAEPVSS